MRPTRLLTILMLTVATGCSSTAPPETTSAPINTDLNDPTLQALLGAPSPEGFSWQRNAGGITIVGFTSSADPNEIESIEGAIADLPAALLSRVVPRFLVRTGDVTATEDLQGAVTVSVGPDILLLDRTFSRNSRFTTRLDLAYALAHELAHVAQWYSLTPSYINEVVDQGAPVSLADGSQLVEEFASAIGWQREQSQWALDNGPPPTPYAGTGPVEDQAETVALAALGRTNWLDPARLEWVVSWMGTTAAELEESRPWVPLGAIELAPAEPLFDEAAVASLASGGRRVEPLYLSIEQDAESLADAVAQDLRTRGFVGSLGELEAGSRYRGEYETPAGITYLVEIRDSGGGDSPETLLTYVAVW